jgi:hypothetical protein
MAAGGRDHELAQAIEDPFLRRSVKTALHLRRYLPFYVFGTIWVVTLAAFPSIRDAGDGPTADSNVAAGITSGTDEATATTDTAVDPGAEGATVDPATGAPASGGTTVAAGGSKAAGGAVTKQAVTPNISAPPSVAISVEEAKGAIQRETGTTRAGVACGPGVPQVSLATYSMPCQNRYDGPNGGATFRGVTEKEILIVRREFPESANSQAVDEFAKAAGAAGEDVAEQVRDVFIEHFNNVYELYGRKLKFVDYESENGDSTAEAQSKGKDGACLDADKIAKEIKAFMVYSASAPFGECAAERKLMVNAAGAYYPETYYKKYHPYLWAGVTDCERSSTYNAEYIGKRLLNRKAKWAKDPLLQQKTRKFGIYVPDNDEYQLCVGLSNKILEEQYGVPKGSSEQYNYVLDVSRFPDQAAQAAVQFNARGVTTVVLACDPISSVVLTQAATKQGWGPEWYIVGTALNDTDAIGRLMDQEAVNGHLFGQSQLGDLSKLWGPTSEPGRVYKAITGKEIPPGTEGGYFTLLGLFNKFQAAGPIVTPENIAAGIRTIPPAGAPTFAVGYTSYLDGPDGTKGAGDHTAIDDAREVYWVSKGCASACTGSDADPYFNGADGKRGTFKETYGGKRFNIGEWPAEEPPIYPPR